MTNNDPSEQSDEILQKADLSQFDQYSKCTTAASAYRSKFLLATLGWDLMMLDRTSVPEQAEETDLKNNKP